MDFNIKELRQYKILFAYILVKFIKYKKIYLYLITNEWDVYVGNKTNEKFIMFISS